MSDASAWRDAVDLATLAGWMDRHGLGDGPIRNPELLGGGTQNILLKFGRGDSRYVLRRPPLHKRPESDEIMRREMRILGALAGSDVPHPRLVAGEADTDLLGAAFYLMEPVDGFNAAVALPAPHTDRPDMRKAMGEALVDGIVALSRVEPGAVGLSDFGRTDGWLERQVPRWRSQLEGYSAFNGWPGIGALPPVDRICSWLDSNRPKGFVPGLVHGDYHLANVLYRRDSAALAAIVDWELGSLGDPMLDLGWLMATWPDDESEAIVPVSPWEGFPTIDEVVDRYLGLTGRSSADARWFGILACFKLGSILEGSYARSCAGLASEAIGSRLHEQAIQLFNRALRRIC